MAAVTKEHFVINQLNELFGNIFDLELIRNVAISCNYDVMESSNRLIEISTYDNRNLANVNNVYMNELRTTSYSNALVTGMGNTSTSTLTSAPTVAPLSTSSSSAALSSQNKSKKTLEFEQVVNNINKGYKVLVIMRGLPGSGKSYLSSRILQQTVGYDSNYTLHILSSDDYFYQNAQGVYAYDVRKIEDAHTWNQNRAYQAVSRGFSPIIIDNTNTQMWEMKPYATMGADYGYIIEILEPDTHWCFNEKELSKRNIHGVPRPKIKDMIDRYEKHVTATKLLSAYNIVYKFQQPPQMRLYPPIGVIAANPTNVDVNVNVATNWTDVPAEQPVEPIETINLMNFDDEEATGENAEVTLNETISAWSKLTNNNDDRDVLVISSDEENDPSKSDDLYSQWGIKESYLKSWDIVTPLNDAFESNLIVSEKGSRKKLKRDLKDGSTSVEDELFRLVKSDTVGPGTYGELKVLETVNRDINNSTPKRNLPIALKLTLDKSCMTEDIYEDQENHIVELKSLFPNVPERHLIYWYSKCKGDLEWTIEFLLEAKGEVISLIDDDVDKTETAIVPPQPRSSSPKHENTVKKKMKRTACDSDVSKEDRIEMKKLLESKFDIGREHYSQHLRKVKQFKTKNGSVDDNARPSTSVSHNRKPSTSKSESSNSSQSQVITLDSDIEFDDEDAEGSSDKQDMEETVELNLGETFVAQLEKQFAHPNIQYPKGFLPIVQMPVSLARQLYTFYIESVFQQMENQEQVMDTLAKEDEEFARKLQASEQREFEASIAPPTPNLKEIMVNQRKAGNVYQAEIDKWKNFSPDTLTARLTKQKLMSVFPTIAEDLLVEVLHAHNNNYKDTVETLIASTTLDNVRGTRDTINEPPIKKEVVEEMKAAQMKHCIEELSEIKEQLPAARYREEASKYLNKRKELYQKAQQYHQRGMREVAQFYSGLASLQTLYFDKANHMAATAFLDEHAKRLQDFYTLDLHYLYVKEAVPALDLFLDTNINLLKCAEKKAYEYLQIITGRGKRSENGLSKIKPAVLSRLKKRNVRYMQLNPGLLKVKITKTSLVTSELVP